MNNIFTLIGEWVCLSLVFFLLVFIWYWTLEYTLRLFKVNRMILQFWYDRMKRRRNDSVVNIKP